MLTKRDRVRIGLPASGGASLSGPGQLAYRTPRAGRRATPWQRFRLALIAGWRATELDRELATGAVPNGSALLAVRERQLVSRHSRARLADGLRRAARDAQAPGSGFSAAVQPDRCALDAARTVLAALERRLRDPDPVCAQGMALLRDLLTDGGGPLYQPSEPGALAGRLRAAAAVLGGGAGG